MLHEHSSDGIMLYIIWVQVFILLDDANDPGVLKALGDEIVNCLELLWLVQSLVQRP